MGNKIDLRNQQTPNLSENKAISYISKLSNKYGNGFQYIETSALTGENITRAFENLAEEIGSKFSE